MTEPYRLQRRVAGYNDYRLDGIGDLLHRARDRSVMDVGCNRGMAGLEFATYGASVVHGCDYFPEGIATAREIFVDIRNVKSQFEVVDLRNGPSALSVFGGTRYDIVLLLAVVHKLRRAMDEAKCRELVRYFGNICDKYVGWRGVGNADTQGGEELEIMDSWLGEVGLRRVQTSWISHEIGPAAIWERK